MANKTSHRGLVAIEGREGIRLRAYRDSKGLPTIGCGHLIVPGDGYSMKSVITQAECDALFAKDVAVYENAVNAAVKVSLQQNQYDALVSICLNIGAGGFKNSTIVKRLNAKNYAGAAEAIMFWKKPPEIIGRRRSEQKQFLTPYPNSATAQSTGATPAPAAISEVQNQTSPPEPPSEPLPINTQNPLGLVDQAPTTSTETVTTEISGTPPDTTETTTTTNTSDVVGVKPAKANIWTSLTALATAGFGYYKLARESFGDLVDRAQDAIDIHFILNVALGAGLVALGLWLHDRSRQRAAAVTQDLIKTAADPSQNTVQLTK